MKEKDRAVADPVHVIRQHESALLVGPGFELSHPMLDPPVAEVYHPDNKVPVPSS